MTVTGANGAAPAQGVNFRVAGQTMNASPVAFVSQGGGVWKATLSNNPLLETTAGALLPSGTVKSVTAVYTGANPNYTLPNPTAKTMTISKEDGRVAYSGPATVQTAGGGSAATIPLTVKVKDISNTPEAAGDTAVGNILLAKVTFINRGTGATIAANVTVVVDPEDPANGLATFNWPVDIGANPSQIFQVGFIVSSYYNRNSTADNVPITVFK